MHATSPSFIFITLSLLHSVIADAIVMDRSPPSYLKNRYDIWASRFQPFSDKSTSGRTTETMQYAVVKSSGDLNPNAYYVAAYVYMTPLNRTLSVEGATFNYFQCTSDGSGDFDSIDKKQCDEQNKIGTWVVKKEQELSSIDVADLVFGDKRTYDEKTTKVLTFQTGKNPSDQTTVVEGVPAIVVFYDKDRAPAPTVRWIAPMPMDI
ncbi:hypothetical protein DL89DRAFT_264785 [Linderina pennispora]|uniref:Uncharacterized protein n=1 Tax=Linderina pennispora TaxID=61395 RepID=A0A1Y1WNF3_9FUNG|nr:uncharacterized protein DL89DRAFT_264785 [Linderina pennispora]ORX74992.1 hypothetical protein DL89DRAFT_264785 [Linderina pennispora]